ncbi:hypothetical protein BDW22DRAFT_1349831 [Trametopsis cervina]|nr:hypothetical protein BDW22DRAFT_1349831 [Trametopsis cervina]
MLKRTVRRINRQIQLLRYDLGSKLNTALGRRTPTTIESLPQELFEEIIDLVQDDKATLRASSLVCRAWRPHSQRRLLSTLCLGPPKNSRDPIPPFLASLASNPQLCTLVHELVLKGDRGEPELHVSARWLAAILEKLPNVKTVRLLSINMTGLDRHFLPPTRFRLEFLELFETSSSWDATVENILDILALFDSIGRLVVGYTFMRGGRERVPPDSYLSRHESKMPGHLSIRSFAAHGTPDGLALWIGLLRRMKLEPFVNLTLSSTPHCSFPGLKQLLQATGAGLRRLEITVASTNSINMPEAVPWDALGFAYCARLEELIIHTWTPVLSAYGPSWRQLCVLLDTLRESSSLRHLTIGYKIKQPSADAAIDWSMFKEVLRKFDRLEEVTLVDPTESSQGLGTTQEDARLCLASLEPSIRVYVSQSFPPSSDHCRYSFLVDVLSRIRMDIINRSTIAAFR